MIVALPGLFSYHFLRTVCLAVFVLHLDVIARVERKTVVSQMVVFSPHSIPSP